MLNEKMIMTGSNVVKHGKLKEQKSAQTDANTARWL